MTRGDELSRAGTAALKTIGDRELPDTTLPEYERDELKRIVRAFESDHSYHALAYLSSALWDAAERKREKQEDNQGSAVKALCPRCDAVGLIHIKDKGRTFTCAICGWIYAPDEVGRTCES